MAWMAYSLGVRSTAHAMKKEENEMKKNLLAAFFSLLLLSGWAMAAEIPSFPFVFVSGQAEREVVPDKATVSFGVQVFNEDPDKALSVISERSAELMSIFGKYGIENADVVAYEINKETVRQRKDYVALGILGYELTRRMSVTVRMLGKFDALMTQIVGLKNVTSIQTVFDTTKRKEIEADLFREAAQKTRDQADLLAKGFGSEIASVHAISSSQRGFGSMDSEFGMGPNYRGYGEPVPAGIAEQKSMKVFVPNTIKLKEAVSAIFRLK